MLKRYIWAPRQSFSIKSLMRVITTARDKPYLQQIPQRILQVLFIEEGESIQRNDCLKILLICNLV